MEGKDAPVYQNRFDFRSFSINGLFDEFFSKRAGSIII
jgi:hypothetical protein